MVRTMIVVSPLLLGLAGCVGVPSGIEPVKGFDVTRYQGKWYEIARLDHSFERGLTNVSATYTLRKDGGLNVLNRGFDKRRNAWKHAEGRAYFVKQKTIGSLKVTFFWPFYGAYNIVALDHENYSYALVCSSNRSYLWLLARDKTLDSSTIDKLLSVAHNLGFEVDKLIFVEHDRSDA